MKASGVFVAILSMSFVFPVSGATTTWTVPGVVKTSGLNGTHFVSDLVVTNAGTSPALVLYGFAPALPTTAFPALLGPGQSVTVRDVIATVFSSSQAVGALKLTSDQPLVIRARTYNDAASGTFGVALPVISDDRFLSAGDAADSPWIQQDAASDSGFRTNIAVFFPDSGGGAATVTLYDSAGNAMGQKDFSATAAAFQQVSAASFATAPLPVGRARIQVTRGRAAGYTVVNDNVTGDASLFRFEDLPAGAQDVVISGAAHANGRNGTFFRTDARLYNPALTDASVTVSFNVAGDSNPSPASQMLAVPAGKILDLPDILAATLGLPVGSTGSLRFRSNVPVSVLCRTSNVDPTGAHPGTFGSQQRAVPLLSYLTSADAGALVSGVNQNTATRTNVGFAAGADGAAWTLSLKAPAGNVVATSSGSLGPFGWTQPSAADLFSGTAIPDGAQILVKVTAGTVDVYDSSIDNSSGDSVITPAAPLPAAFSSSATIGAQGGTVRSDDGRLTLRIPAGALSSATAFSITAGTNGAPGGVGAGYVISPSGRTFAKPVWLVLGYTADDVNGSDPGALGLAWQNSSSWYTSSRSSVDTAARTFTMEIPALELSSRAPASRGALAPGGDVYSPYTALGVVGPSIVLQRDHVDLQITVVRLTPQSTGVLRLAPDADVASFDYTWSIDGGGAGSGTITRTGTGSTARYQAPDCPPPANLVVLVNVHDAASGGPIGVASKSLRVLWKDWKYTITEAIVEVCLEGWTFNYSSQAEVSFSLDATGAATNIQPRQVYVNNGVTRCPLSDPQCNATQMDPVAVTVTDLSLRYFRGDLIFTADYIHMSSTTVTITCPTGTGGHPATPGVPDHALAVPVDAYAGGEDTTSNGEVHEELRPVKGSCS